MVDEHNTLGPVGGAPFFLALLALGFLSIINILSLTVVIDGTSIRPLCFFAGSFIIGSMFAKLLIRGRLSVFLHELKHSILSNLVGNRARGMKVERESGHFAYAYSKHTAHMNAFIALAPYWLPLFTVPGVAIALVLNAPQYYVAALAGFFYGIDALTGLRDASPHQPDLYNIRGGFPVSIVYLFFSHLMLVTLLMASVAGGYVGLELLALGVARVLGAISGLYQ